MRGEPWTDAELATLERLTRRGMTVDAIAERMGRSIGSVRQQRFYRRLRKPTPCCQQAPDEQPEPVHAVLLCAEPADYWLWLGRSGEPPAEIIDPLPSFCTDSETGWCQRMRDAGRCHLTDDEFEAAIERRVKRDTEGRAA